MKVNKHVWLDVGDGSLLEVLSAIQKSEIPSDAKLTKVCADKVDVSLVPHTFFRVSTELKFEWSTEE